MRVTIIIPIVSFSRFSSLLQEIRSIEANTYKDVFIAVIVDGNSWLYMRLRQASAALRLKNIEIILSEKRMDWVFLQNQALKQFDSDYYICACDDFIFPPECIENAVDRMQRRFPDGDGVISLWRRSNPVIALFGRKWIERFPDCVMFCPEYTHYCADSECAQVARKLNKVVNLPGEHRVKHVGTNDETHSLAQKARSKDCETYKKRESKGYKWGIDFNLMGKK